MVSKIAKIYIAGHRGMVGSAVWRALENKGYESLMSDHQKDLFFSQNLALRSLLIHRNQHRK